MNLNELTQYLEILKDCGYGNLEVVIAGDGAPYCSLDQDSVNVVASEKDVNKFVICFE
jgi:hypothetical protein